MKCSISNAKIEDLKVSDLDVPSAVGRPHDDIDLIQRRVDALEAKVRTIEGVLTMGVQALIREALMKYDASLPERIAKINNSPRRM